MFNLAGFLMTGGVVATAGYWVGRIGKYLSPDTQTLFVAQICLIVGLLLFGVFFPLKNELRGSRKKPQKVTLAVLLLVFFLLPLFKGYIK